MRSLVAALLCLINAFCFLVFAVSVSATCVEFLRCVVVVTRPAPIVFDQNKIIQTAPVSDKPGCGSQ